MGYIKTNMEPLAIGVGVGCFLCGWSSSFWVFGKLSKLKTFFMANPTAATTAGITFP